jgi:hypothetical protein
MMSAEKTSWSTHSNSLNRSFPRRQSPGPLPAKAHDLARSATQLAGLPIAPGLRELLLGAPDGDLRVVLAAEPVNTLRISRNVTGDFAKA